MGGQLLADGAQSEVMALRRIVLRHARDAFLSEAAIERQWRKLGYLGAPDLARAVDEYDQFIALLEQFVPTIDFLSSRNDMGLDSIYVRDAAVVYRGGVIICSMGKEARRSEPEAHEAAYRSMGIPVCGAIKGTARVEGGDVAWIAERTLVVGQGYRTNREGIRQLGELLGDSVDELIVVPLPHWRGPDDVMHLMSIYSPVDDDLAVVYSPLMPVPFREALLARDIDLVEVDQAEFETLGCNVLAIAPRKCVIVAGNPETRAQLLRAGVEVHEFEGREICLRGGGGPTCLTRPLVRG